jgi:hypothetical protein
VVAKVAAVPNLSGRSMQIAGAIQSGQIGHLIRRLPPSARRTVGFITRAAFTAGLNRILLVAAIIALAAGLITLVAIRTKDFVQQGPSQHAS